MNSAHLSFRPFLKKPIPMAPVSLSSSSPPLPPTSLPTISLHRPPFFHPQQHSISTLRGPAPPLLRCRASKKNESSFTDRILDYIEGGPKLRKWYGAPDLLPKDGGLEAEEGGSPNVDEVQDAVLVTDGESDIGQMVIVSLILKRARVKAVFKDKRAAVDAFGTYVEPMAGDVNDKLFLTKAMRGVRTVISPSSNGFFSDTGRVKGVQHIVLLSQLDVYRGQSGIQAIMNSKLRKLAERDEEVVIASGIPYTIVRAGLLHNSQGGKKGFCFNKGIAAKGKLSKVDAALICVEALDAVPKRGLDFEVVNGEETVSDWKEWFGSLMSAEELQ